MRWLVLTLLFLATTINYLDRVPDDAHVLSRGLVCRAQVDGQPRTGHD